MEIGNRPKSGMLPVPHKRYWWLSVGNDVMQGRYFDNGWRAVEFIVLKPYGTLDEKRAGEAHPYLIRIAFVFWFPFYLL